jgi:hypothetical protein
MLEYNQKVWWDGLFDAYLQIRGYRFRSILPVTSLFFFTCLGDFNSIAFCRFSSASCWLSVINPNFIKSLYPDDRLRIQPSFVLAGPAMAMLMRSSQTERGAIGRERAI